MVQLRESHHFLMLSPFFLLVLFQSCSQNNKDSIKIFSPNIIFFAPYGAIFIRGLRGEKLGCPSNLHMA